MSESAAAAEAAEGGEGERSREGLGREVARCIELLEWRLTSGVAGESPSAAPLSEMSAAAAQSPPAKRPGSSHQHRSQAAGGGASGGGASGRKQGWGAPSPADGRQRASVVLKEYEGKVARAAAGGADGKPAYYSAAFEASLAHSRGERPPSELRLAAEAAAAEQRQSARASAQLRAQRQAEIEAQRRADADAAAAEEARLRWTRPPAYEAASRALRLATTGLGASEAEAEAAAPPPRPPRLTAAQLDDVVAAARQQVASSASASAAASTAASAAASTAASAAASTAASVSGSPDHSPPQSPTLLTREQLSERSEQILTREQIKAQYLEKIEAQQVRDGEPLFLGTSLSSSKGGAPIVLQRPSTAEARGRGLIGSRGRGRAGTMR